MTESEPLLGTPMPNEHKQGCFERLFWTFLYLVPFVALMMSDKYQEATLYNAAI